VWFFLGVVAPIAAIVGGIRAIATESVVIAGRHGYSLATGAAACGTGVTMIGVGLFLNLYLFWPNHPSIRPFLTVGRILSGLTMLAGMIWALSG
jgi:hypothetical protein